METELTSYCSAQHLSDPSACGPGPFAGLLYHSETELPLDHITRAGGWALRLLLLAEPQRRWRSPLLLLVWTLQALAQAAVEGGLQSVPRGPNPVGLVRAVHVSALPKPLPCQAGSQTGPFSPRCMGCGDHKPCITQGEQPTDRPACSVGRATSPSAGRSCHRPFWSSGAAPSREGKRRISLSQATSILF